MAPADMPALGSSSRTKYESEAYPSFHRPKSSSISTSIPDCPPPVASSSTVLSTTPPASLIAGGNAECYDGVREMLCSQPQWGSKQEEVSIGRYNYPPMMYVDLSDLAGSFTTIQLPGFKTRQGDSITND
jgi:hypothetical protein